MKASELIEAISKAIILIEKDEESKFHIEKFIELIKDDTFDVDPLRKLWARLKELEVGF